MAIEDRTEGVTPEELLERPLDLLVLVGADGDEDDADADSEDEDGNEDEDNDGDDEDSDEDEGGDDKDKSKDKDKAKDKADDKVDRKEYDRVVARRTAAESRVTKLLADIEDLKAKGTSDEDLKREVQSTKDENSTLRTQVETLSRANAFLSDNTHAWIDPAAALKLLDDSNIEIDENGVTQGLKPALDKLAKDKPYLLQAKPKPTPRPSGDQPRGGRSGKKTPEQQRKTLQTTFPALRGR